MDATAVTERSAPAASGVGDPEHRGASSLVPKATFRATIGAAVVALVSSSLVEDVDEFGDSSTAGVSSTTGVSSTGAGVSSTGGGLVDRRRGSSTGVVSTGVVSRPAGRRRGRVRRRRRRCRSGGVRSTAASKCRRRRRRVGRRRRCRAARSRGVGVRGRRRRVGRRRARVGGRRRRVGGGVDVSAGAGVGPERRSVDASCRPAPRDRPAAARVRGRVDAWWRVDLGCRLGRRRGSAGARGFVDRRSGGVVDRRGLGRGWIGRRVAATRPSPGWFRAASRWGSCRRRPAGRPASRSRTAGSVVISVGTGTSTAAAAGAMGIPAKARAAAPPRRQRRHRARGPGTDPARGASNGADLPAVRRNRVLIRRSSSRPSSRPAQVRAVDFLMSAFRKSRLATGAPRVLASLSAEIPVDVSSVLRHHRHSTR